MNSATTTLWTSPEREPVVARIAVGGDFLPAGNIEIATGGDWRGMSKSLADHLQDISTSFVNLECCLDTGNLRPRPLSGLGDVVSAPADSLDYLKSIRAVAVGIANNHSLDFADAGVARTRAAISRRAMVPLGAGRALVTRPSLRLGRAGAKFARVLGRGHGYARSGDSPQSGRRACYSHPRRKSPRRDEKTRARVSIALLHAGCLRTSRPDPEQLRLMDSLANFGFNIVAASHSHRIAGYGKPGGQQQWLAIILLLWTGQSRFRLRFVAARTGRFSRRGGNYQARRNGFDRSKTRRARSERFRRDPNAASRERDSGTLRRNLRRNRGRLVRAPFLSRYFARTASLVCPRRKGRLSCGRDSSSRAKSEPYPHATRSTACSPSDWMTAVPWLAGTHYRVSSGVATRSGRPISLLPSSFIRFPRTAENSYAAHPAARRCRARVRADCWSGRSAHSDCTIHMASIRSVYSRLVFRPG